MAPNRTGGVPSMRKIQLQPALGRYYLSDYENLSTVDLVYLFYFGLIAKFNIKNWENNKIVEMKTQNV